MSRPSPRDPTRGEELDATLPMTPAESGIGAPDPVPDDEEPRFFDSPKRIVQTIVIAVVLVVAIYLILPQVLDAEDGIEKLGDGDPVWITVAVACAVAMFASYVALFRGVVGGAVRLRWREGYQVTMAGLAATRLFSAGGAGGIVLTYWALRKAGMPPKDTASRMVAFNVLLYAVYMLTLMIDGILMSTGVFDVPAPPGLTIVPAAIAGGVIIIFLLFTFVPGDLERRFSEASQEHFWGRTMRRVATVPSTLAVGTREAFRFVREPERGTLAIVGAIGFWAAQIAILWAAFKAFGGDVPIAVVVQGFFVGMLANLIPLPGGVGGVDAGMIGAFALFNIAGLGDSTIFAAVLTYRLVAFWLPLPPGIVAFIQLRRTVAGWERRTGPPVGNDVAESLPGSITS
jgi:uncharacterized protein (TIRG00374 family)